MNHGRGMQKPTVWHSVAVVPAQFAQVAAQVGKNWTGQWTLRQEEQRLVDRGAKGKPPPQPRAAMTAMVEDRLNAEAQAEQIVHAITQPRERVERVLHGHPHRKCNATTNNLPDCGIECIGLLHPQEVDTRKGGQALRLCR